MRSLAIACFIFVVSTISSYADDIRLLTTPCRLLDTRSTAVPMATGYSIKARGNPGPGALQGGQLGCGVPTYAVGMVINLITTQSTSTGHGKLWAYLTPEPTPSTINFSAGETTNDGLIVRLAPWSGEAYDLTWSSTGSSAVIIDVIGWIAPSIESVVGQVTGLFTPTTLIVETLDGIVIKAYPPGEPGEPFYDEWAARAAGFVGDCVHIDGTWFDSPSSVTHNAMEARGLPLIVAGYCGPSDTNDYAIPEFRHRIVIGFLNAEIADPQPGDAFIIYSGIGIFAGHDDQYAVWNGTSYHFENPRNGDLVFLKSTGTYFRFWDVGAGWDPI